MTEPRNLKQAAALDVAKLIRSYLSTGNPKQGLNPALPHSTEDNAGFGITICGHRCYVTVDIVRESETVGTARDELTKAVRDMDEATGYIWQAMSRRCSINSKPVSHD